MIFEIWCEGYNTTGQYAPASFMGEVEANSFGEACAMRFKGDSNFNLLTMTYWGCRLFDNQAQARELFG